MNAKPEWQQQGEWTIKPAGEFGLLIELPQQIDRAANQKIHNLARRLAAQPLEGISELVPGYCTLFVQYDPMAMRYPAMVERILAVLQEPLSGTENAQRVVEIPTIYGGDYGPDLAGVAGLNHLDPDEVVRIHSGGRYFVFMMGFTPGFPYLGGLDKRIATTRLATPRTLVPAGAVGIAGDQTGVYSITSPGGWRIIGRTALKLFDREREDPFLLQPGDEVHFVPVTAAEAGFER